MKDQPQSKADRPLAGSKQRAPFLAAWQQFLIARPIVSSAVVWVILLFVIVGLSWPYDKVTVDGVLTEAHGLLFDLLLFGVILMALQHFRQNALERRTYRNELSDFRGWFSPEAAFKNAGNIRRLKRLSEPNISANQSDLSGTNLSGLDLSGITMQGAVCAETSFVNTDLSFSSLQGASFAGADLRGANLEGSSLTDADLTDSLVSASQLLVCQNLGGVKGLPEEMLR
ncbi:MAG: pentapeptide repeat-containing protein, partial [Pseudomonadota bacterium]